MNGLLQAVIVVLVAAHELGSADSQLRYGESTNILPPRRPSRPAPEWMPRIETPRDGSTVLSSLDALISFPAASGFNQVIVHLQSATGVGFVLLRTPWSVVELLRKLHVTVHRNDLAHRGKHVQFILSAFAAGDCPPEVLPGAAAQFDQVHRLCTASSAADMVSFNVLETVEGVWHNYLRAIEAGDPALRTSDNLWRDAQGQMATWMANLTAAEMLDEPECSAEGIATLVVGQQQHDPASEATFTNEILSIAKATATNQQADTGDSSCFYLHHTGHSYAGLSYIDHDYIGHN